MFNLGYWRWALIGLCRPDTVHHVQYILRLINVALLSSHNFCIRRIIVYYRLPCAESRQHCIAGWGLVSRSRTLQGVNLPACNYASSGSDLWLLPSRIFCGGGGSVLSQQVQFRLTYTPCFYSSLPLYISSFWRFRVLGPEYRAGDSL